MCGVCSAFHVPRSVVSIAGWDLNPRPPGYEPGELPDCSTPRRCVRCVAFWRAGNGTRTRDPNLGKVVLYQLSYSRAPPNLTSSSSPLYRCALPSLAMEARGIEPLTS